MPRCCRLGQCEWAPDTESAVGASSGGRRAIFKKKFNTHFLMHGFPRDIRVSQSPNQSQSSRKNPDLHNPLPLLGDMIMSHMKDRNGDLNSKEPTGHSNDLTFRVSFREINALQSLCLNMVEFISFPELLQMHKNRKLKFHKGDWINLYLKDINVSLRQ